MTEKLKFETIMTNWNEIDSAPFDRDLQLSVIENYEVHQLAFACRRSQNGWIDAATGTAVDIDPTHWRLWPPTAPERIVTRD